MNALPPRLSKVSVMVIEKKAAATRHFRRRQWADLRKGLLLGLLCSGVMAGLIYLLYSIARL